MRQVIQEKKTNHSLRATGATAMFAAQVPEKMIKDVTGHKSSKALALYERHTVAQKQGLSMVLAGSSSSGPTSFSTQVNKVQQLEAAQKSRHISNSRANPAGLFSSLFQGLTNCTINFSPQSINIGVGFGEFASSEVDEFDSIVTELPMDNFD